MLEIEVEHHEQLGELHSFRGKNADVVEHMMHRIKQEKASFERGLQRYTALRTVYTQQTNALYGSIGLEALRATATRTRKRIEESPFTSGVRAAMSDFFGAIRGDLEHAARRTSEIHEMMEAMYLEDLPAGLEVATEDRGERGAEFLSGEPGTEYGGSPVLSHPDAM